MLTLLLLIGAAFFAGNLSALFLLNRQPALRAFATTWRGYVLFQALFLAMMCAANFALPTLPLFLLAFALGSFCFTLGLSGTRPGKG